MSTKQCKTCHNIKAFSYFPKAPKVRDGHGSTCKDCLNTRKRARYAEDAAYRQQCNARSAEYRKDHEERAKEYHRQYYLQHREELVEDARIWAVANAERVAQNLKIWRAANGDHARELTKRWISENTERYLETKRRWAEENEDKVRAAAAEWRKNNPDKVYAAHSAWVAANPDKVKTSSKRWTDANPDILRINRFKRRARLKAAEGTVTKEDLAYVVALWQGKCWVCGVPHQAIDHVIPLAKGGSNLRENLRPICAPCNSSKGAKIVDEKWLAARRAKLGVTCIPQPIEPAPELPSESSAQSQPPPQPTPQAS